MSDYEEKEIYVYLDFKGKVELNNYDEQHFLRVADLHTSNPLVQIDDLLYKGTYEDCVGTNLFFTEEKGATNNKNCFEKESSISLKYMLSQNKIINLKCVKVNHIEQNESLETAKHKLNLDEDYATVLKKLASGTLKIEDVINDVDTEQTKQNNFQEPQQEHGQTIPEQEKMECVDSEEINETNVADDCSSTVQLDLQKQLDQVPKEEAIKVSSARLLEKYEKLRQLARRPVYREVESKEEVIQCEDRYKKQFEYHNIERQILQRGDSFPVLDCSADYTELQNVVDVNRCVLHNIIPPINRKHPIVTNEDRKNMFKMENFEFLSLPTRLFVLENQLEQLKTFVEGAKKSELTKADEFGRTPQDTLEILQKLVTNLKVYLNTIKENSECKDVVGVDVTIHD